VVVTAGAAAFQGPPMAVPKLRPRRADIPKLRPRRESESQRQGRRWRTWAGWYRMQHPTCERCRADLSDEVHHVVPVSEDPTRTFDVDNVKALCKRCHHEVHAGAPLHLTEQQRLQRSRGDGLGGA